MKKVKLLVVMSLIVVSSILGFSGCEKRILMDEEKCAEVALEYMENKYQEEFEVLDSGEVGKFMGKAGYAEVTVRNKTESSENKYYVVVYPDGSDDKDDDGYYDGYKVISDDYMCQLINDYVKKEVDTLLIEAGVTKFFSSVSIQEGGGIEGFWGFGVDFPVQNEKSFSLKKLLDNRKITMICWLEMPEREYCIELQNSIIDILKPLLKDDLIMFNVEIYNDEHYKEIEEFNENKVEYDVAGDKSISFTISEENEDE